MQKQHTNKNKKDKEKTEIKSKKVSESLRATFPASDPPSHWASGPVSPKQADEESPTPQESEKTDN